MRGKGGVGQRQALSHSIGVHPGYLSKIFHSHNHFSLEQAQSVSKFLFHAETEASFFLNLVSLERAGTGELKNYFKREIKRLRDDHDQLKNRITIERMLTETEQAKYYSAWYFSAIHVAVSLEFLKTPQDLATALGLPLSTVNLSLEFLSQIGVLVIESGKYSQGAKSLFLTKDSPFFGKHQSNWKIKSIQSLDYLEEKDFHYTGIITCSKADAVKIRDLMFQIVQNILEIVKPSKDETALAYTIDLFKFIE